MKPERSKTNSPKPYQLSRIILNDDDIATIYETLEFLKRGGDIRTGSMIGQDLRNFLESVLIRSGRSLTE